MTRQFPTTLRQLGSLLIPLLAVQSLAAQQADVPLRNWKVPAATSGMHTLSDATPPRAFIGLPPCRIVDTRGNGAPIQGGIFAAAESRNYALTGICGLPAGADAVSLNVTVTGALGTGFIKIYPQGGSAPVVSTVNYVAGQTIANAAIVPLSSGGAITVVAGVHGTHVVIDINGYFSDVLGTPGNFFNLANDSASYTMTLSNSSTTCGGPCGLKVSVFGNGATDAIHGQSFGTGAGGGVYGSTSGSAANAYGVTGQALASSGMTFGVVGSTASGTDGAAGVRGTAGGSGSTFGVQGITQSGVDNAAGVKGIGGNGDVGGCAGGDVCLNAGVRGVNAASFIGAPAYGVLGVSASRGTGGVVLGGVSGSVAVATGFLGYVDSGSNFYGVFSIGDFGGTGAKYFVEPDRVDPTRVIRYVALEGPEAGTYFRGTARTSGREAVIDVPETFRQVTDEEGITVQLTPVGELATMAVVSQDLNQIVVRSSRDVTFHYMVNGVRSGYRNFRPETESEVFAPAGPEAKLPAYLNEAQKRKLIENGTYREDGSVNRETADRVGWTTTWAEREAGARQPRSGEPGMSGLPVDQMPRP